MLLYVQEENSFLGPRSKRTL